jgi:hypothetical protein
MANEADSVPQSAAHYRPEFERRPGIPDGVSIDTNHPRFKAAAETAHRAGLTQRQFSALLTHEVESTVRAQTPRQEAAKPTAEPRKIEGYENMTMQQKLAAAGHT